MIAPRRRWFRFSLRTLFVAVTLVAFWMAYQLNWIRQRHELIATHLVWDDFRMSGRDRQALFLKDWRSQGIVPASAPGLLWLFGEEGITDLRVLIERDDDSFSCEEHELSKRAQALFPESTLSWTVLIPSGEAPPATQAGRP